MSDTTKKRRGRPAGSKSTVSIPFKTLVEFLPENAMVAVGTKWLEKAKEFYGISVENPIDKTNVPVQDASKAKPRERIAIEEETLD